MQGTGSTFLEFFTKITTRLKFSIMLYEGESGKMHNLDKGEVSDIPVPESIAELLKDPKMFCTFFSNEANNIMVLYFIRLVVDSIPYVIIVQDNKKHSRINKLIAELVDDAVKTSSVSSVDHMFGDEIKPPVPVIPGEMFGFTEETDHADTIAIDINQPINPLIESSSDFDPNQIELPSHDGDSELQKQVNELQQKLKTISEDLSKKYTKEIELYKSEIEELKEQLSTTESTLLDKDIEIADRDAVIREKDKLLASKTGEDTSPLKKELDELREKYESEKKNWEKGQLGIPAPAQDKGGVSIAPEELESLREAAARLPLVQAHLNSIKFEMDEKDTTICKLKEDLQNAKDGNHVVAELPKATHKYTEGSLDDLKDRLHQMEDHAIKLQVKLSEKEQEILSLRDSNPAALKKLKDELEAAHLKYEHLVNDIDVISAERDAHQRKVFKLDNDFKDIKSKVSERDKKITELQSTINELEAQIQSSQDVIDKINELEKILEEKSKFIAGKEQEVNDLSVDLGEKTKLVEEYEKKLGKISDNVVEHTIQSKRFEYVLKKMKISVLSVDNDDNVLSMSNILPVFAVKKAKDATGKLFNDIFKEEFFDYDLLAETREQKEQKDVSFGFDNKYYNLILFPITDREDELVEVVAVVEDITEFTKLNDSVEKFKDQLKTSKKARATNVNEISALQADYDALLSEKEKLADKNTKMMKIIEKLSADDKIKELVDVKSELKEIKGKLLRSTDTIKNYENKLEDLNARYIDLNKRTFMQLERLLNILKTKAQLKDEVANIVALLTREFEAVKENLGLDSKKSRKEKN